MTADIAPKPLAFSYIRMSTDAQLKGDSLRRQAELSRDYAQKNGLSLVEDFELRDIGISAFKGDNATTGALKKFLDAITANKVPVGSFLLVESLDRLSRDKVTTAMRMFLNITDAGVNIVTLADGQVYQAGKTDFPQLVYSMAVMSRANEESAMKSRRVGAAWSNKRSQAGSTKMTAMAPKWLVLSSDRKRFDLVPDRAEVVRKIYRLAGEGHGNYSITKLLNQEQVPPFGKSDGWNESYVEKILKTRAVLGEFQPHTKVDGRRVPEGEIIAGYYPVVLDEVTFMAVQAARRGRATKRGGRKGSELKNLFTHIATCAYCGSPMRMVDKGSGPKGGRYLRCSRGVRGAGCTTKGWRYDDFERSFLFLATEVDLQRILNAEAENRVEADIDQQVAAHTEKQIQLQIRRERMLELMDDPNVGVDFIRGKLTEIEATLVEISTELQRLHLVSNQRRDRVETAEDIRNLINELKRHTGSTAYELRSRVANRLKSIVTSLEIAVQGERHRLVKTSQFLDDQGVEPAYRDAILQRIDEVNEASQSYNPSFKVTFADGIVRRATITTTDPTQYVNQSIVRPDGSVDVEIGGTPAYSL